MRKKETRMGSFLNKGNNYLANGEKEKAMNTVTDGLTHYTNRIVRAISPYATPDAGLIIIALRHLADEIGRLHPWAKEYADGMEPILTKPELCETEKIQAPTHFPEKQ